MDYTVKTVKTINGYARIEFKEDVFFVEITENGCQYCQGERIALENLSTTAVSRFEIPLKEAVDGLKKNSRCFRLSKNPDNGYIHGDFKNIPDSCLASIDQLKKMEENLAEFKTKKGNVWTVRSGGHSLILNMTQVRANGFLKSFKLTRNK